jgi:ABC-type antimicrobial peptide transport system permease subunit
MNVLSLSLRQGTAIVSIGIGVGMVAAFAGGRILESVLYGVSWRDSRSFAASAALMILVATAATLFSSWGATRVDPAVVLRDE